MEAKIKHKRGFTLIEILVAISIVAILIAVAYVNYSNIQKKARDSKRKSDLAIIQQNLERYYQQHGRYPVGDGGGPLVSSSQSYNTQSPWISGLGEFTSDLPRDPVNTSTELFYNYEVFNNGQRYHLMINLENDNDLYRRSFDEHNNLIFSPCDETAYFEISATYKNFPQYDYCATSPR